MLGHVLGLRLRHLSDSLKEPFAVLQAALLGVVGLILAFGLALAVDRYESRRAAIVTEANAIGTTYLRAQTLPEPSRSRSLALLPRYTDTAIRLSKSVPGSPAAEGCRRRRPAHPAEAWGLAGRELDAAPDGERATALRGDPQRDDRLRRLPGVRTQQPGAHSRADPGDRRRGLALGPARRLPRGPGAGHGRRPPRRGLVTLLLLVTFDLDRPTRGFIRVPATPLTDLRDSMERPPAAAAPREP